MAFGYLPSHPPIPLPASRNLYLELGWKPGNGCPGNCNRFQKRVMVQITTLCTSEICFTPPPKWPILCRVGR